MWTSLLPFVASLALAMGKPQGQGLVREDTAQTLQDECRKDGVAFMDSHFCDRYWQCKGGVTYEQSCDDGLVFDEFKGLAGHPDPCDSPFRVDCSERPNMQDPTYPSADCPRRHGIFQHPDPSVCNVFHICKDGYLESAQNCADGLHFNNRTGACEWPWTAERVGCSTEIKNCIAGGRFCCYGDEVINKHGVSIPHPTYADEYDCQKFYVCQNSRTPQESSCGAGEVYNANTTLCDYPENVPECYGWYRDDPRFAEYYEDAPVNFGTDVGAQDFPN